MKFKFLLMIIPVAFLISCEGKKEVQLTKANESIITSIGEHSPVYIFYKLKDKDTVADLNRANTISSTHWVFTIDERLPLRLVVPKIIEMQTKKEGSMHKSEVSENYFSYADTLNKNLAFFSFSKIKYKLEKPKQQGIVYVDKNEDIYFDGVKVNRNTIEEKLKHFVEANPQSLIFCFSKECSFGTYLKNQMFIQNLKLFKSMYYNGAQTVYVF